VKVIEEQIVQMMLPVIQSERKLNSKMFEAIKEFVLQVELKINNKKI